MTTPLQKAAQALIERWDSPAWKDQPHTANYIAELRKALDAEIAQAVEPVAVFNGLVDSGEHGAFNLDMLKMIPRGAPLYLHPPQPQATTAVPEGLLEAIRLSGHTLVKTKFGYRIIDAGTVTAQGEKP